MTETSQPALTPRQRMITAIQNGIPDRVPATPDISNMVPCRLTGKPFWDIYYRRDPPLWEAYLNAARFYGIDPWFNYAEMHYKSADKKTVETKVDKHLDYWLVSYRHITPVGERTSTVRYDIGDPPTQIESPVKNLPEDMDWLRAWLKPPLSYDPELLHQQRALLGDSGAFAIDLGYPGLQSWFGMAEGGLETLVYWVQDYPELMDEWRALQHEQVVTMAKMAIQEQPDYLMLGGSGTITMQSPALARRYSLPTVKEVTRLAKEAGIPTMLHSCGKSKAWIKMCAEETDLSCINPLEIPPMGDITLKEAKQQYGQRLALMGNLHTTEVMLFGTAQQVMDAARQAIEDAGEGGGFILSTGDQCGRDTPDANLLAMVEAAERYGRYE